MALLSSHRQVGGRGCYADLTVNLRHVLLSAEDKRRLKLPFLALTSPPDCLSGVLVQIWLTTPPDLDPFLQSTLRSAYVDGSLEVSGICAIRTKCQSKRI